MKDMYFGWQVLIVSHNDDFEDDANAVEWDTIPKTIRFIYMHTFHINTVEEILSIETTSKNPVN